MGKRKRSRPERLINSSYLQDTIHTLNGKNVKPKKRTSTGPDRLINSSYLQDTIHTINGKPIKPKKRNSTGSTTSAKSKSPARNVVAKERKKRKRTCSHTSTISKSPGRKKRKHSSGIASNTSTNRSPTKNKSQQAKFPKKEMTSPTPKRNRKVSPQPGKSQLGKNKKKSESSPRNPNEKSAKSKTLKSSPGAGGKKNKRFRVKKYEVVENSGIKCKQCNHHWMTQGCKAKLCRRCCKKRERGFCKFHLQLEKTEFEDLKYRVLKNLESYGNEKFQQKPVTKSCGLEETLKHYGETATIFCFMDFAELSKFSKEALNPNSRRNRNLALNICKNQAGGKTEREKKRTQRLSTVLSTLLAET